MEIDWSEYNKITVEKDKLLATKKLLEKKINELSSLQFEIHQKTVKRLE